MAISTKYSKSSITSPTLRMTRCDSYNTWGVILAGGDGLPRRSLVPSYLRGQRPRHFCRTADSDFIINQTREQVSLAIPRERIMYAVSEDHLRYAEEVLEDVPSKNMIVEPQDDGTTFAVLYSLLRIRKEDPNAVVVFFPPDLSVPDPRTFMARVRDAIVAVQHQPKLILLGIEPTTPDTNRKWIERDLSAPIHEDLNVWPVLGLTRTVSKSEVRELIQRGGLWNSSVVVGKVWTFLAKIRRAKPALYARFKAAAPAIGTPSEAMVIRRIYYDNYTESDLAQDVLQKNADQLGVIPVAAVKVKAVGRVSPMAARSMQRRTPFATIGGAAARA